MKLTNQRFGYGEVPSKEFLENLYPRYKQQEIANKLGTTKTRVRKWLKYHNIDIRPRGAGNNQKYYISKEKLVKLIKEGYKNNEEIAKKLGCTSSNIHRWICKYQLNELVNEVRYGHVSKYRAYCSIVYSLTNKVYEKNKHILNPTNKTRGICGIEGNYQVDHVKPIKMCFIEGLTVEECASLNNLQFISWEQNLEKRKIDYREENNHE